MKLHKRVYVLQGHSGRYCDRFAWIIAVFEKEIEAFDILCKLNELVDSHAEEIEEGILFINEYDKNMQIVQGELDYELIECDFIY
jgi:hypothetical protein